MSKIREQDFNELIEYVLDEYCGHLKFENENFTDGKFSKQFGTITVVVSKEEVISNHIRVQHYDILNQNGATIVSFILGNVSMLFSKRLQPFREELLSMHTIKGVITLKQRIFKKICIPAAIIVFNKKNIKTWFTSIENKDMLTKNLLCEFDQNQKVYWSIKIDVKNMMPEYYNKELKELEKKFSGNELKKLSDLATIYVGGSAKQEDFGDIGIPYLRGRDIQDGNIVTPIKYICLDKIKKFGKWLLQEGDILLTKNFGLNKLSLVTKDNLPAVASNGLFIIRPYAVSERYLYKYLTSETGNDVFNKQLMRIQQGVTIQTVAISDLRQVLVPIYDIETMENIEDIDSLSKAKLLKTIKLLATNYSSELQLEKKVYHDLIKFGWKDDNFTNNVDVFIENNILWKFNFVYILPDERKVYIEIKTDLSHIESEWILAIKQILYGYENCFYILTTGLYYEVHASGIVRSLRLAKVPTMEDIIRWEKEVR